MAQSLKPNSGGNPGPGHNSDGRDDAIKALDAALRPLETQKAKIQADIKQLRHEFKADTEIPMADFDAARRLALIENEVERRTKRQNQMDVYNALSPGEQMLLLDGEGGGAVAAV